MEDTSQLPIDDDGHDHTHKSKRYIKSRTGETRNLNKKGSSGNHKKSKKKESEIPITTNIQNFVSITNNKTQVKVRKRSRHIQEVQDEKDLFDNDLPPDFPVDTRVVERLGPEDLYDDYEKDPDKGTPFEDLPVHIQEKFTHDMQFLDWYKEGATMESVMSARKVAVEDKAVLDNCPVVVGLSHMHEYIQVPYTNPSLEPQNRDNTSSAHASIFHGDYEDSEDSEEEEARNPYSSSHRSSSKNKSVVALGDTKEELLSDPLAKLDERNAKSIMRLYAYRCFENFIQPKLFQLQESYQNYDVVLKNLFKDLFQEARIECMLLERRFLGDTAILKKKSPNEKELLGQQRILVVFRMEEKDLYYLCMVMIPLKPMHTPLIKEKQCLWNLDKAASKDGKEILETTLRFESYFYFTCGCGR